MRRLTAVPLPVAALLLALAACAQQPDVVAPDDAAPTATATATATVVPTPGATAVPVARPAAVALSAGERVSIRMRVRNWSGIDAEMDNVSSNAVEGGGDELAKASKASVIRDLGSRQVPWVKGQWPPMDNAITLTFSRAQWRFILAELSDSIGIYESIDDSQSAALARQDVSLIQRQLTKPARTAPGTRAPGTAAHTADGSVVKAFERQVYLTPFAATPVYESGWAEDRLLGVSAGPSVVLLTGVFWGDVEVTIHALDGPPPPLAESLPGWEVGEEETIEITEPLHGFAPVGEWYAEDAYVPARPGLHRVRVLARGRVVDETFEESTRPLVEHYDVSIWPVERREPRARVGGDALSNRED